MAEIKRDEERERLARWYGAMSDEELKEIAKREGSYGATVDTRALVCLEN